MLPRFLALELRGDRKLAEVVAKHPGLLRHTPLRSDKKLVLAAVKKDGSALRYASDDLRACKEVVVAAVKSDAAALSHVLNRDALFKDKDVVAAAKKKGVELVAEED